MAKIKKDPKWYEKLGEVCMEGTVDELRNFLKKNTRVNLTYKNGGLASAACGGNIEVLHYLLTSNELTYNPNIHAEDDAALVSCANIGIIESFDFLLFSPLLKEHANIHADNDGVFVWAMRIYQDPGQDKNSVRSNYDFLRHLIIDLDFPRTEYVQKYLQENPCPEIERLFEIKEDVATMQKQLPLAATPKINKKI